MFKDIPMKNAVSRGKNISTMIVGGESISNPLQCLENPRDGGAWWAAVYGVAQSRTQLKRLSSSSEHENFSMKLVYLIINWESYVFKEWDS